MEGKLIKRDEHYFFWSSDWNPDKKEGFVANTTNLLPTKLSLKNCQAIENGYDLDSISRDFDYSYDTFATSCFKDGFQKALEIVGDKKSILSEEDLHRVIDMARLQGEESFLVKHSNEEIIESLQQTEWDVIVEMEEKRIGGGKGYGEYEIVPTLDADGCLILKRK
jgi:hypothetical protein